MRIIPLYGEVSSIGANQSAVIAEFQVPNGHVAEIFEVGVIPDYDPSTGASYLDGIYFAHSSELEKLGTAFEHSNLSANYNGKNAAPYGDIACKQPPLLIDYPSTSGNLTYKEAGGKVLQIVGKAGSSDTGKVRVRARIAVYSNEEVPVYFGVDASEFTSLPGGPDQRNPVLPYFEYFDNAEATAGNGAWEDIKVTQVQDYEEITLTRMGIAPSDNCEWFRIYDSRVSKYFPSLDNYPFRVTPTENVFPFGGCDSYQPTQAVPADLAAHVFTNTNIHFQLRDNGNSVPADGIRVQLFGIYKKLP